MPTTNDHFTKLPNELLLQVFGYIADLNGDPPSMLRFTFEPSLELTRSAIQPLKTLSLVCQRWRHILLANVFRHARVTLMRRPCWVCLCTPLETKFESKGIQGRSHHSNCPIKGIHASVESSPDRAKTSKYPEYPIDLEHVESDENRQFMHWPPAMRSEVDAFIAFARRKELLLEIKSLVLQTDQELTTRLTGAEETIIVREIGFLWKTFLATFNLSRLVIVAPPSTMAALTSSRDSPDTWAFEMPLHYLSFSTEDQGGKDTGLIPSRTGPSDFGTAAISQENPRRQVHASPHNLHPWRKMAYNEGTMLPGYAHYEWQTKLPPRILPCLLNFMSRESKLDRSPKLQSFEYISNFPYSYHIEDVMGELNHFHGIRLLKVKLAELDYLDDNSQIGKGLRSDVWKEWEDSYKKVVTHFIKGAETGTVFEIVDATVYGD
jgi:hypothetical protein